jgi:hypothetical protein
LFQTLAKISMMHDKLDEIKVRFPSCTTLKMACPVAEQLDIIQPIVYKFSEEPPIAR